MSAGLVVDVCHGYSSSRIIYQVHCDCTVVVAAVVLSAVRFFLFDLEQAEAGQGGCIYTC